MDHMFGTCSYANFVPADLDACDVVPIYGLLIKGEVKLAGDWPSFFYGQRRSRGP